MAAGTDSPFPNDDYTFALCLTHDLDRPYKTWQAPYYAVRDREVRHLYDLRPGVNPWWQFDTIRAIETELGVRSTFYVLREPPLRQRSISELRSPATWVEALGAYDPDDPRLRRTLRGLAADGWEIGLHGSLGTCRNPARLRSEKLALEETIGRPVLGGRQHHLEFAFPETWHHYADAGLRYDSSLGSNSDVGFEYGYDVLRPFDDHFLVFPLTLMDSSLAAATSSTAEARERCESLLDEAAENGAVMTICWHPRNFCTADFPGDEDLYRGIVRGALDRGAWVGPPAHLYTKLTSQPPATAGNRGRQGTGTSHLTMGDRPD